MRRLTSSAAGEEIVTVPTEGPAHSDRVSRNELESARRLAVDLVDLLGPMAHWRANRDPVRPSRGGGSTRTWSSVTRATFGAAVVGRGAGHCAVVVDTDED
ncbi:hypothetical protein HDA32_005871 [Spinactinospora alkalitolerans]|uniref:Uncharacterized protein n=1 Tax=Spinactinospora alkalitolerans TaxID=687207 RepID=A0A852U3J2_9ACTN|nr:hypothetical protein [Spinactinospora alkalitolerans]NYE50751.1 hypothetical protein [Spinactinospora alkalitolerans]